MMLSGIELMNQNYLARKHDNTGNWESKLGEIQEKLSHAFFETSRTEEEISTFESHLYGNSKAFGDKAYMYSSVDEVYQRFAEIKNTIYGMDNNYSAKTL